MSDVLLDEQNLYDIADAIREKLGVQTEYLPSEMASAIGSIAGTLGTKTITENGIYNATDDGFDGYSQVTVNVGGGIVEPTLIDTYGAKVSNNQSYTVFTADEANSYSIYVILMNSEASTYALDIAGKIDNVEQTKTAEYTNSYTSSGTNKRNYRIAKYDVQMSANDEFVVTVSNVSGYTTIMVYVTDSNEYNDLNIAMSNADSTTTLSDTISGIVLYGYVVGQSGSTNLQYAFYSDEQVSITTPDGAHSYGSSYIFCFISHASKIYFGESVPDVSQGNDGDYYYRRVKEPAVGVGYWDNRQNSNTSISGYRFTTTEDCVVVGVRVYNRSSARTVTAGIYESNGTAIEEVTAEASANGWTTLMFEHSHTLQDATTYYSLANWGESGHAVYRSTYTIATDSRITSLVGAYNSTSNPSIDNDNVYGCDLLLENPSGDYYIITEQYVKEDGAWVRLDG